MCKRWFTVPDIYTDFTCKAGECRKTCCHGWHITLTMQEYYKLIGLNCSPELRRRLDGGIYMLESPTNERYAEFAKNYIGDCKMHGDDGLCTVQCECGEDCLPSVCRYYPRSPKTLHGDECSMSASCEGVCELLMKRKAPIGFKKVELEFKYYLPQKKDDFITSSYEKVRKMYIGVLQDRSISFSERMKKVVMASEIIAPALNNQSSENLDEMLAECESLNEKNDCSAYNRETFETVRHIIKRLCERFPLDDYSERINNTTYAEYEEKQKKFSEFYPDAEIISEQLFVNHVFYMGFPYIIGVGAVLDCNTAAMSLAALYAVWRAIAVTCTESGSFEELSDITSEVFKMAETSNYYMCAAALLHETGCDCTEKVMQLCSL